MARAKNHYGILSYARCAEILGKRRASKLLAPNTFLCRDGAAFVLRLYQTDLMTFYPNGSVVYRAGEYRTATTLGRFYEFGPAPIRRDRIGWLVRGEHFVDGMEVGFPTFATEREALESAAQRGEPGAREMLADYAIDHA